MRILITGASGLIGKKISSILSNITADLVFLAGPSQSAYEFQGQEFLRSQGFSFIVVDLVSGKGMEKVTGKFDVIVHLAASTETSKNDHRCNSESPKWLVPFLKDGGHFIYTSTLACIDYRNVYSVPVEEKLYLEEMPLNEYGRMKLLGERFLLEKSKKLKFELTIIRLPTTYGPDYRPDSFFEIMRSSTLTKRLDASLNSPGLTSLLFVDDVADFISYCAKQSGHQGEPRLFHLSAEELTLADIFKIVHDYYQVTYRPLRLPAIFWKTLSYFTERRRWLEVILPQSFYNTV
jgi:nucleoside-diphosphate-sugar epimerase